MISSCFLYAFGVSLFHIPSNSLQMINSALFDLNMGTFTLCVKDLSFVKWEGWLMEPKCSVREGGGMAHKRSSSEDKDDVRHLNSDPDQISIAPLSFFLKKS